MHTENNKIWNSFLKKTILLDEQVNNDLEALAIELYSKYGDKSHKLGNLLLDLSLNKGKFKRSQKKIKHDPNMDLYGDTGRTQTPTSGW